MDRPAIVLWRLLCGLLLVSLPVRADGGVDAGPDAGAAPRLTVPASRDATLYEEAPATSNGDGAHFFAGITGRGDKRRGLVAFDVAAYLPSGTTITGATLRLLVSRTSAGVANVSVHRVTSLWGEGTSRAPGNEGVGVPSTDGDASWSHGLWDTSAWTSPGGDFDGAASARALVDAEGAYYSWSGPALVEDVQRWLDQPETNFGWLLLAEDAGESQAKRFQGRRGGAEGGPELVVTYAPLAGAAGACCKVDGTCGVALDPGASCVGTYQGASTTCGPNPCPPPVGACCLPDAPATCTEETSDGCGQISGRWSGPGTSCQPNVCPVVLERFVDPLPRPPAAVPTSGSSGAAAQYRIAMREARQKLHRDLPATTVWGYDDGTGTRYPGPTIQAKKGAPIEVTWVNDLRDASGALRTTHVLPVDECVHGAPMGAPRTVVHLHGGHVASEFDGQPELGLAPGEEARYEYPNAQDAATLWYHDHALGITRLNVAMGLAGLYVLGSDEEAALDLPRGEYDVPLVIQDRSFAPDGSFRYPAGIHEHVFGNTVLVNGKVWPYLEVAQGLYRFRVLNGSGSRTFTLVLSNGSTFYLIGTDGGLLESPVVRSTLTLAPGERAEIVVDFSNVLPGTQVDLRNSAPAPFPGGSEANAIFDVMRFVVVNRFGHTADLPDALRTIARLDVAEVAVTRELVLERHPDPACGGSKWMINGLGWHDVTERPMLGTSEIWSFVNRSGVMHPMHVHLVMFQVIDRQNFTVDRGADGGGSIVPAGQPRPVDSWERGWKDTVQVNPFEIVRVIARFEGYAGHFPYHCHILEHEDHEMMRQFEVVTHVCGDRTVTTPYETCDDGNTTSGDGCSATCSVEEIEVDAGEPDAAPDGGPDAGAPARPRGGGSSEDGCGCRVAGAGGDRHRAASALVLAALASLGLLTRRGGPSPGRDRV